MLGVSCCPVDMDRVTLRGVGSFGVVVMFSEKVTRLLVPLLWVVWVYAGGSCCLSSLCAAAAVSGVCRLGYRPVVATDEAAASDSVLAYG